MKYLNIVYQINKYYIEIIIKYKIIINIKIRKIIKPKINFKKNCLSMYKSNIFQKTDEILKYSTNRDYNYFSPPYNSKLKSKAYYNTNINNNILKYRPINLYSSYYSPFQTEKNLSVKNINSPDDKISQNLYSKFSPNLRGTNSKIIGSPNTTNSDLCTVASLTSQKSNESLISNNTNNNTSVFMSNSFQQINLEKNEFNLRHRYNYSMINPGVNLFNSNNISNFNISNNNNNIFINGNNVKNNLNYFKGQEGFIAKEQKINKLKKDSLTNFNSNSSSNSDKSDSCKKSSSNNSNKSNIIKKGKIYTNPRKKYYNKFNSSKENSTNDNTVILTLKIKIAKNDFRFFNLKKYDDLFISLEKFFDLNKIDQSLVKPIVNKIFAALNKIFWLLNNKIGNYDKKYLNSLYNLWKKNDETLPKRKKSKEKSNNTSTISSSDSNDDINKNKKLTSNSFQDMNNLSEDEKDEKQKTSKSI